MKIFELRDDYASKALSAEKFLKVVAIKGLNSAYLVVQVNHSLLAKSYEQTLGALSFGRGETTRGETDLGRHDPNSEVIIITKFQVSQQNDQNKKYAPFL